MRRFAGSLCVWLGAVCSVGCAIATQDEAAVEHSKGPLLHCDAMTIHSREELEAARDCAVIDGDLKLAAYDLGRITADDLPNLERVTGSLVFVPAGAGQVREITLPALREVGSEGAEEPDLLEIGWDAGSLQRIAIPQLRTVHGSVMIAALGALTDLDFPELSVIDVAFILASLPALRSVRVADDLAIRERVSFSHLCQLPSADLPGVVPDSEAAREVDEIGCCTRSALECEWTACRCAERPAISANP